MHINALHTGVRFSRFVLVQPDTLPAAERATNVTLGRRVQEAAEALVDEEKEGTAATFYAGPYQQLVVLGKQSLNQFFRRLGRACLQHPEPLFFTQYYISDEEWLRRRQYLQDVQREVAQQFIASPTTETQTIPLNA